MSQPEPEIQKRMKHGQNDDPTMSAAIKQLNEFGVINHGQFRNQLGMNVRDGLLCRGRKIVVPYSLRQEVITIVHPPRGRQNN